MSAASQLSLTENLRERWSKCTLVLWSPNQALGLSYCLSHSRQECGALYWKVPLPDKEEKCYEWLVAFQFVYDSVCLHSALLNWLRNRLEMVLLLYTSHNSPSHQSRAIFYLEDDVSIRVCQPLTAALWVVVLGESIVNQHNNNNNRISLAGVCTSLGCGKAVHQMTAHPEHTQEQAHRQTQCLSITLALFYSLCYLQTQKFTDVTKSDNRDTEKKTGLGQREGTCQLFFTSFSVSSNVWGADKVQLPIWQLFQSPNTKLGIFQRLKLGSSLLCTLLSSLTLSLDAVHVSNQALVLRKQDSFKAPRYTQSKGTFCS